MIIRKWHLIVVPTKLWGQIVPHRYNVMVGNKVVSQVLYHKGVVRYLDNALTTTQRVVITKVLRSNFCS